MADYAYTYYYWPSILTYPNLNGYRRDGYDSKGNIQFSDVDARPFWQFVAGTLHSKSEQIATATNSVVGRVYSLSQNLPSTDVAESFTRSPRPNKDFRKRCAQGEIVVAPYSISRMKCVLHPGEVDESRSPSGRLTVAQHSGAQNYPFSTWLPANWRNWWTERGAPEIASMQCVHLQGKTPGMSANQIWNAGYFVQEDLTPWALTNSSPIRVQRYSVTGSYAKPSDFNLTAAGILSDISNAIDRKVDNVVIMEASAWANGGDLDVLTAIAELPETIKMILDGFMFMKKVATDVRKKEVSIHSRSKQLLMAKAKEKYARYKGKDDFATFYKKRQRYLRKLVAKDITNDVANTYLQGRYAIAPTIYTLADIGNVLLNLHLEFRRYRAKLLIELDIPSLLAVPSGFECHFEGTAELTKRAFIKRVYELESITEKLSRALLSDIAVTAFEKLTYWISIIGNWFITFETALKSIKWRTLEKQEGACYSTRVDITGTLTFSGLKNGKPVLFKADLSIQDYDRIVINPQSHLGLYWNPDLNIWRKLDAVAFGWKILQKDLPIKHPSLKGKT